MIDTLLANATNALRRRDLQVALWNASEACHTAPNDARAHYCYGEAWTALGNHANAERAFAAAIQLRPDWADAWVNYGVARYRQGEIGDAKTAMRQALRAQPGNAAAAGNLAAFMRISGESDSAEALMRQTLEREPDNQAVRLNLAADLLQRERAAEALALLDAIFMPTSPDIARFLFLQRALALLQLNRPTEAAAALAGAEAQGPMPAGLIPLWRWRRALIAQQSGNQAGAVAEAAAMETALRDFGEVMVPEHRIMAHYDLAKFWSGLRDPGRAIGHWTEGHGLLRRTQPFSREQWAADVDAKIAAFSAERFAGPRASNNDAVPIFIVGMPRSGTTLCEQILAAHPAAFGAGERSALSQFYDALGGTARIVALSSEQLDAAAERYLADLHGLVPDKARVVDKMPGNYTNLGLVGLMLPGARIIHCTRDPRDIGLSIFTFRFHGYHPYAHDLADIGWTIAEQERLMAHWKTVLPNPILTVRLNDWVEDFAGTLARVLDHVGLPHDPACERFYENESDVRTVSFSQVRQPVNARGLGRWRGYEAQLAPLIGALRDAGALAGW